MERVLGCRGVDVEGCVWAGMRVSVGVGSVVIVRACPGSADTKAYRPGLTVGNSQLGQLGRP